MPIPTYAVTITNNKYNTLVVDLANSDPNAKMTAWTSNGHSNQKWVFDKVDITNIYTIASGISAISFASGNGSGVQPPVYLAGSAVPTEYTVNVIDSTSSEWIVTLQSGGLYWTGKTKGNQLTLEKGRNNDGTADATQQWILTRA